MKYYTINEVCQRWGIVPSTVSDLLRKKELGGLKIGRSWRISEEDVLDFEERHTQKAQPKQAPAERHYITKIT
jgi:excisionase family DNA binding protein